MDKLRKWLKMFAYQSVLAQRPVISLWYPWY